MWFLDLLANLLPILMPKGTTRAMGSLEETTKRFPRSTVRRAELVEGFAETDGLQAVAFIVANHAGLSFRDAYGHEELMIRARDIDKLLLLSGPDDDGQHLRVSGRAAIEFWSPGDAGDVHADLAAALHG